MTDEEAIRNTIGEYCQLIDDQRWDEFADLFTPDAVFTTLKIRHEGREKIRAFLEQIEVHRGIHGTFNPVIYVEGDTARASADYIWVGVFDGTLRLASAGRYCHRLVRDPDRWRIAELDIPLLMDPTAAAGGS